MKVLKQPNTDWTMKHTCEHCEAELEVEKSDVKWSHYVGDVREPAYDSYFANCIVCHRKFDILDIPKAVISEIQRRCEFDQ